MIRSVFFIKQQMESTNNHSAQGHQKSNIDSKDTSYKETPEYYIVYTKNHRRIHCMGLKMEHRWIVPSLVVESFNKGSVKLKNISCDKIFKNTYHDSNLKVYSNEQGSYPISDPMILLKVQPIGAFHKRKKRSHCKKQTSLSYSLSSS